VSETVEKVDSDNTSKLDGFVNRYLSKILANPFRSTRSTVTFIAVAGCVFVLWLTLQPKLIFTNTTPTGGDMGAHVWWPAYMKDVLLPHGRIFGWTMDNYAGFPVGQYYFPVPALMVVVLNIIFPYNIAFKLVTVLGSLALPVAAYCLGRSVKAPKPVPMFMAFASTAFLYFIGDPRGNGSFTGSTLADYKNANFNQHIMGGPLLSSMAGEFSFSIALAFGLFFLASFFIMLRERRGRSRTAVLFALTLLSHLVVAIFIFIAVVVFWGASYAARKGLFRWLGYALLAWICVIALCIGAIGRYFFDNHTSPSLLIVAIATLAIVGIVVYGFFRDRISVKTIGYEALPLITGLLVASIWMLPMLSRFAYTSNMRYEKLADLPSTPGVNEAFELYISPHYFLWPVFIPALIGFILSATMLRKNIIPLIFTAGIMAVVFYQWPEGHAWNLRFLPFWYLFAFLVAAVGYGEILRLPNAVLSRYAYSKKNQNILLASKILRTSIVIVSVLFFFVALIGVGSVPKNKDGQALPDNRLLRDRRGFAHFWASYNFEGYEGKPAWPEFKALIDKMNKLPPGRALWETAGGSYGTTLALTLLPYFTDHKISSMEGLYYEAAGSTAYHFLNVAEVSKSPSNPMRWPKCPTKADGSKKDPNCFDSYYGTIADFHRGVEHMRVMGVNYYLAQTPEAKEAASHEDGLKLLGKVKDIDGQDPFGWNIYEVKQSPLVEGLSVNPVVMTDKKDPSDWEQSGNKWLYDWWQKSDQYPLFVDGGPSGWIHETAKTALSRPLSAKKLDEKSDVKVSKVKLDNQTIHFHVDKVGEPVLVKVSYYPTFKASGAGKIYRASPNFMVVIPTKHDVTITIKRDGVEWLSILFFIVGITGCVMLYVAEKRNVKLLSAFSRGKH
jgi:hypothetical protein